MPDGTYIPVVTIRYPCNGDHDLSASGFPVMGTTNGASIFLWTRALGSDAVNGPFIQLTQNPGIAPITGHGCNHSSSRSPAIVI
jgi:hypothetical protein